MILASSVCVDSGFANSDLSFFAQVFHPNTMTILNQTTIFSFHFLPKFIIHYYYCQSMLNVLKRLREAVRRKRPEAWINNTWMLHHDNAPAHASLLTREFLTKRETTVVPQAPPLPSRFGPCGLLLVPEVKFLTKRSPISDGREDRRKFDKRPSRHPAKHVPGRVPELEKKLGAVYQEWWGSTLKETSLILL